MHLPITSRTDIEELSSDGRPFGRLPRMVPHQDLDVLPDNLGPPEIHKATALQPLRRCELAARMVIFGRKASGIQRRNEMAATALIRATNSTVRGTPVMLAQTSVLLCAGAVINAIESTPLTTQCGAQASLSLSRRRRAVLA
jgi:hypothetical protein